MSGKLEKAVYVVSTDTEKVAKIEELRSGMAIYSIVVMAYENWDFFIPNWIFAKRGSRMIKFFDQCGENWFFGDSSHYLGYTWIRDVPQKPGYGLDNFLDCLDTDYVLRDPSLKNKPFKKSPNTDPTTTPGGPKCPSPKPNNSRKKTWRDQPDWKKRSGGDYD